MPWKVRKRNCRQKSTDKTGSHVVVKIKGGGGEEQESCHVGEPKAQGALRARYASKNEAKLRAAIQKVIREAAADVVQMGVRVRVADRAALNDVLTNLRGVVNVITVRQEGPADDAPGPFKFVNLFVTFEDDAGRDVFDMVRDVEAIDGVESARIKNYEGTRWSEVEKTYTGGAASKSGNIKIKENRGKQMKKRTESRLRKVVRNMLKEVFVTFDGETYDIPQDEIDQIKQRLQYGALAGVGGPADPEERTVDDTYMQELLEKELGELWPRVNEILSAYKKAGLYSDALAIIARDPQTIKPSLFSVSWSAESSGELPQTGRDMWQKLSFLENQGTGFTVGRGELALSLLLKGVAPDSGGGEFDLNIGGSNVHVKALASGEKLERPDSRMGKSVDEVDRANDWAVSLKSAGGSETKLTIGFLTANAIPILTKFGELRGASTEPANLPKLADEWQADITKNFRESKTWNNADAVLFMDDKGTGKFISIPKEKVVPSRIEGGKWRVGRESSMGSRLANALKAGLTPK